MVVSCSKKKVAICENSVCMLNILIVFPDKSKCTDSTVNSAAQGLLQCLESRNISSSDLTLLHQMKSLILLQDIDRLKDALKQFQEHSVMPPGMYYWLMIVHWCSFFVWTKIQICHRFLCCKAVNNCILVSLRLGKIWKDQSHRKCNNSPYFLFSYEVSVFCSCRVQDD